MSALISWIIVQRQFCFTDFPNNKEINKFPVLPLITPLAVLHCCFAVTMTALHACTLKCAGGKASEFQILPFSFTSHAPLQDMYLISDLVQKTTFVLLSEAVAVYSEDFLPPWNVSRKKVKYEPGQLHCSKLKILLCCFIVRASFCSNIGRANESITPCVSVSFSHCNSRFAFCAFIFASIHLSE